MALDFYKTLERLALTLPHYGDISQAAIAITLVFHAEILHHPWGGYPSEPDRDKRVPRMEAARRAAWDKLRKPRDFQHLITVTIRELQKQGVKILVEKGPIGGVDGPAAFVVDSFHDNQRELILEAWNALGEPPVYTALANAIEKV